MESNIANKGKKFNSEFPPFVQQIYWVTTVGNIMLGTEITAVNKIYIVPALVGSVGYKRDQQTFPVKGQIINILVFAGFTISIATIQPCP